MLNSHTVWLTTVFILLLCVGCGGKYESRVTGVVTLDGEVLPQATVAFYPVQLGPSAHGRTDESGSYSMGVGREQGLPSGEYTVTVVASEVADVPDDWVGPPPPGELITPAKYGRKSESGLRFSVEQGSNEIAIELSSS